MDQNNTGTPNPIAQGGTSTTNENNTETTNKTTVESTPPASATPTPSIDPKKPKGLIATTIILAILATAGIAFGIYFFMDSNNKSTNITNLQSELNQLKENPNTEVVENEEDEVTTIVEPVNQGAIDNNIAQNIIDPYIKSLGYNNNIFKNQFTEDIKTLISYVNVNPILTEGTQIPYDSLNVEYQALFGDGGNLEQRTFSLPHGISLTYNPNTNRFEAGQYAGGGTGGSIFSIIKQASILDDNLVVDVYSDIIPWCDADGNGGYCYNGGRKNPVTLSDGNMGQIIANYSDRIPVYEMSFTKNSGHYVLTNVQTK